MDVAKDSIDLGVVVRNVDACRRFYGDELGFPFEGEMAMAGAIMYRYRIGTTVLKLVKPEIDPPEAPGGMRAQSGLRYFTISVKDLDQAAAALREQGHEFTISPREIRPGVRIAILPDPDGNMVELLENRA